MLAMLIADYCRRDDHADLVHAHQVHHAPERLAARQRNIETIRAELDEWERRLAYEMVDADRQVALIAGDDLVPQAALLPEMDQRGQSATDDGTRYRRAHDHR